MFTAKILPPFLHYWIGRPISYLSIMIPLSFSMVYNINRKSSYSWLFETILAQILTGLVSMAESVALTNSWYSLSIHHLLKHIAQTL